MSHPAEPNKHIALMDAESPTTARPLEMDDDDVQDNSMVADDGAVAKTNNNKLASNPTTIATPANTATPGAAALANANTSGENAPQKPPRPLTEAQKNIMILKEAFPTVDDSVIRAVMRASGGQVEPAFNALLEMTDPDAVDDEPESLPPPQPPRPQGQAQISQVEADALYARQLAQHYDNVGAYEARTSSQNRNSRLNQSRDSEDRERSFMDDDLPVIRENLRKGFLDTQSKVNGWITNIRKKIEESFDETEENSQHQGQPSRRQGEASRRRSGDYERYDADPQVLSDDFAGIKLPADGTVHGRPMVNSGIHRPPPPSTSLRQGNGRRVGFKEETEEMKLYDTSPTAHPKDTPFSSGKPSKWRPLSSIEPSPITDNDPFSLGDSEDEKEASKDKLKDTKAADNSESLKKAAAEAMDESLVEPSKPGAPAEKKS